MPVVIPVDIASGNYALTGLQGELEMQQYMAVHLLNVNMSLYKTG